MTRVDIYMLALTVSLLSVGIVYLAQATVIKLKGEMMPNSQPSQTLPPLQRKTYPAHGGGFLVYYECPETDGYIAKLREDRERLRVALEEIASIEKRGSIYDNDGELTDAKEIAAAALASLTTKGSTK